MLKTRFTVRDLYREIRPVDSEWPVADELSGDEEETPSAPIVRCGISGPPNIADLQLDSKAAAAFVFERTPQGYQVYFSLVPAKSVNRRDVVQIPLSVATDLNEDPSSLTLWELIIQLRKHYGDHVPRVSDPRHVRWGRGDGRTQVRPAANQKVSIAALVRDRHFLGLQIVDPDKANYPDSVPARLCVVDNKLELQLLISAPADLELAAAG